MSFIENIFRTAHEINEMLGGNAISDVSPRGITVIQDKTEQKPERKAIFTLDLSLVTIFEIHGTRHHYNNETTIATLLSIATSLKSSMKLRGHTLQVCMHHDRKSAKRLVNEIMDPFSRASLSLGIDTSILTDDWTNVMSRFTANEKVYFAVWTHPEILGKSILKSELKKRKISYVSSDCTNTSTPLKALHTHHLTVLSSVNKAFTAERLIYEELTAENGVKSMRMMVDENYTTNEWEPWQANKNRMPSRPTIQYDSKNYEWIMPEHLGHQIVPRDFEVIDTNIVYIGDKLHYPFMCKLMPKEPIGFKSGFFSEAIRNTFPWRITWTIRGGGKINKIKSVIATVLNRTSSNNRKINDAYDTINTYVEKEEGVPVDVQVSYDTWIDAPIITNETIANLKRQQAQFAGIIQSWGTQEVVNIVGDPSKVFFSSIPGINWESPAPPTLMPIEDVFSYLPIADRAASPWKVGMPLRTPDGKLYPYMPMSTQQASWITFGFAQMGSGKSVLSNVGNYCYVFNPELPDIPFLYIIDVGLSSFGFVELIRSNLPENKKHYACAFTLDNNLDHGINVFDTRLGCPTPTKAQYDFLVNFLTLLATPVGDPTAPEGIHEFVKSCIRFVYSKCSIQKAPKIYEKGSDTRVDKWIDETGYKVDNKTTWWEIVEILFRKNETLLAGYAQRHAVPILVDISEAANDPIIRREYMSIKMSSTGEALPDFFNRRITEVINSNPILRSVTKFDIGEARIASIDLDKFKGSSPEDRKLMAIMFMVSQHITAGKFYQDETDLRSVPKLYKEFHAKKIKLLKSLPKMLVIDELHRITQKGKGEKFNVVADQFIGDLCSRARESRKWGVAYSLWSQIFYDIPEEIIKLASTVYICGINTYKEAEEIQKIYDMVPEMADAMYRLPPPGPEGSSMLAWYRTKDGTYYHILTLTIGLYMLWALSSTKDERNIREALSKEFGFGKALDILVKLYPTNISKIIEERQLEESKKGSGVNVLDEIIKECINYGHAHYN